MGLVREKKKEEGNEGLEDRFAGSPSVSIILKKNLFNVQSENTEAAVNLCHKTPIIT